MALIKVNPTIANIGRSFNGKTVQAFTVDLAVNATDFGATEMGPNGAVQEVLRVLSKNATIVMHSALRSDGSNNGQVFDIYFEGEFPTDTYDGSNSETFAAFLQTEIRTLTTAGIRSAATIALSGESANAAGIDLSSATVVALTGSPFYADQIPV
jgi:hypothetical protein